MVSVYNNVNKNKEKLLKKACKRYKKLSEEEKEKNLQYACEGYKNLLKKTKKEASIWSRTIDKSYKE